MLLKKLLPSVRQRVLLWPWHLNIAHPLFQRNGIWLDILTSIDNISQSFSQKDVANHLWANKVYTIPPTYLRENGYTHILPLLSFFLSAEVLMWQWAILDHMHRVTHWDGMGTNEGQGSWKAMAPSYQLQAAHIEIATWKNTTSIFPKHLLSEPFIIAA